jgi:hypothetical protein
VGSLAAENAVESFNFRASNVEVVTDISTNLSTVYGNGFQLQLKGSTHSNLDFSHESSQDWVNDIRIIPTIFDITLRTSCWC